MVEMENVMATLVLPSVSASTMLVLGLKDWRRLDKTLMAQMGGSCIVICPRVPEY